MIKDRIEKAIDENVRQPIQLAITIAVAALIVAAIAFMKAGK
jgi:hypothetical protein